MLNKLETEVRNAILYHLYKNDHIAKTRSERLNWDF